VRWIRYVSDIGYVTHSGLSRSTFKNTATNEDIELISRGSVFQRDATITLGKDGPVVARVAGQFTTIGGQGWNISIGPHEYTLAVAPGGELDSKILA
jgi:hypothetical protein